MLITIYLLVLCVILLFMWNINLHRDLEKVYQAVFESNYILGKRNNVKYCVDSIDDIKKYLKVEYQEIEASRKLVKKEDKGK